MKIKVSKVGGLAEGSAKTFRVVRQGRYASAFVIRYQGELYVYENKCRHIPISLDYGDAQFFDGQGRYLICQTHGAQYEPDSGLCIGGPCQGASLFPIPFEVDGDDLLVESEAVPEPLD